MLVKIDFEPDFAEDFATDCNEIRFNINFEQSFLQCFIFKFSTIGNAFKQQFRESVQFMRSKITFFNEFTTVV